MSDQLDLGALRARVEIMRDDRDILLSKQEASALLAAAGERDELRADLELADRIALTASIDANALERERDELRDDAATVVALQVALLGCECSEGRGCHAHNGRVDRATLLAEVERLKRADRTLTDYELAVRKSCGDEACADYERDAVVEDHDKSGDVCAVYPTESSVAASEVLASIRALPDPTHEELEKIK